MNTSIERMAGIQDRRERIPINIPSYDDLVKLSGLSKDVFPPEKYDSYKEEIRREVKLVVALLEEFGRITKTMDEAEGKSPLLDTMTRVAVEHLRALQTRLANIQNQGDLFPSRPRQFLVELQLDELLNDLREFKFVLTNLQSMGAWQSPSLEHSVREHVGVGQKLEPDLIALYARYDLSPKRMEQTLQDALELDKDVHGETILVNSGMSAITIATAAVTKSLDASSHVLGQEDSYFENEKHLLSMVDRKDFAEFSIEKPAHFLDAILREDPQVIFFEPVGNSPHMPFINPEAVLRTPTNHSKRYVIMDYTASGSLLEVNRLAHVLDDSTVLLAVTSLQKLYEEGHDVASGGMVNVITRSKVGQEIVVDLRVARTMIGGQMSTSSLGLLSRLSPERIRQHGLSIGKNVRDLAEALKDIPGVHVWRGPDVEDGQALSAFFYLEFQQAGIPRKVEDSLLKKARAHGIELTVGSSFGFRSTRIFAGDGSIRVCPGVENSRQLAVLQEIFREAIKEAQAEGNDFEN